jgi:hypothetical protein
MIGDTTKRGFNAEEFQHNCMIKKDEKSDHMPEHDNYLDEEVKTVSARQPERFEVP